MMNSIQWPIADQILSDSLACWLCCFENEWWHIGPSPELPPRLLWYGSWVSSFWAPKKWDHMLLKKENEHTLEFLSCAPVNVCYCPLSPQDDSASDPHFQFFMFLNITPEYSRHISTISTTSLNLKEKTKSIRDISNHSSEYHPVIKPGLLENGPLSSVMNS